MSRSCAMNSSLDSPTRNPGMVSSLSSVPPVWPSPRPDSWGTAAPHAATSGVSGSVILSPTPPVECLSTVGRDTEDRSSRSPEAIIAAVHRAISAELMPRNRIAISSADICSSATTDRVYASTTQSIWASDNASPSRLVAITSTAANVSIPPPLLAARRRPKAPLPAGRDLGRRVAQAGPRQRAVRVDHDHPRRAGPPPGDRRLGVRPGRSLLEDPPLVGGLGAARPLPVGGPHLLPAVPVRVDEDRPPAHIVTQPRRDGRRADPVQVGRAERVRQQLGQRQRPALDLDQAARSAVLPQQLPASAARHQRRPGSVHTGQR